MIVKDSLSEALDALQMLKEENEKKKADSDNGSQTIFLSDVICPRIFKISFGKHAKGFSDKMKLSQRVVKDGTIAIRIDRSKKDKDFIKTNRI